MPTTPTSKKLKRCRPGQHRSKTGRCVTNKKKGAPKKSGPAKKKPVEKEVQIVHPKPKPVAAEAIEQQIKKELEARRHAINPSFQWSEECDFSWNEDAFDREKRQNLAQLRRLLAPLGVKGNECHVISIDLYRTTTRRPWVETYDNKRKKDFPEKTKLRIQW